MSFWEETVIPMTKMFMSSIACWLSKIDGRNLIIEPDLDSISAISEKRQKIWKTINESDFVDDKEKRESLGFNREKEENEKSKI